MSSLQDKDRSVRRSNLLKKMSLDRIKWCAYPLLGKNSRQNNKTMWHGPAMIVRLSCNNAVETFLEAPHIQLCKLSSLALPAHKID
jgi:hypothetical protein